MTDLNQRSDKQPEYTTLADVQLARLPGYIETWSEHALCTAPADRPRAEAAIRFIYRQAGLETPPIIWTKNPLIAPITHQLINMALGVERHPFKLNNELWKNKVTSVDMRDSMERAGYRYWEFGGSSTSFAIDRLVRSVMGREDHWTTDEDMQCFYKDLEKEGQHFMVDILKEAKDIAWNCIAEHVEMQDKDEFWERHWDDFRLKAWDSVGDVRWCSLKGQDNAYQLAYFNFLSDIGELQGLNSLYGISELCKSAGWAMLYADRCFISERHDTIHTDNAGVLHCADGPALSYSDGLSLYEWHGTAFPKDWTKTQPTAEQALRWRNIEQRRIACEMIGWETILTELDCVSIDKDADPEIGELISVKLPSLREDTFLRVTCGTGRIFALPVPPTMRTARQANAWTWGLEPDQYKPEIRT